MDIYINFAPEFLSTLEKTVVAEKINFLKINWELPFLPQEGDGFDWFNYLDLETLNSFSEDETRILSDISAGESFITFKDWKKHEASREFLYMEIGYFKEKKESLKLNVNVEHPLFPGKRIKIKWVTRFIPRVGEHFLFSSFINEKDRKILLYDWIQSVIHSKEKTCYENDIMENCKKIWNIWEKQPGELNIYKWLHLWYIVPEETAEKNNLSLILKKALDHMETDIENIETTSKVDQIIWNRFRNETEISIILREYD